MTQPIWDSRYWKTRLETAYQHEQLHHAIYLRPLEEWKEIEERHKGILAKEIQENTSIIDVGCGYGRLLAFFPVDDFILVEAVDSCIAFWMRGYSIDL